MKGRQWFIPLTPWAVQLGVVFGDVSTGEENQVFFPSSH